MKKGMVWDRYWPPGMPKHIDYPGVPVGAVIKGSAHRFGRQTALVYKDQSFSYSRLYEESLRVANALRNIGIGNGDVVAVYMSNCPEYVFVYYGILLCGATFTPVNPLLKNTDLSYQLNDCDARAVFSQQSNASEIEKVFSETKLDYLIVRYESNGQEKHQVNIPHESGQCFSFEEFKDHGEAKELDVAIDPKNDLAHVAYTGGTTGRSKGVMLTHYNVVTNILQFACWQHGALPGMKDDGLILEKVDGADRLDEYPVALGTGCSINLTPWYHAMGTIGYLNIPILTGSNTILHTRFEPGKYLEDAEKYRVTNIGGAPPVFFALSQHPDFYNRDLSSVKSLQSGAAPLAEKLLDLLNQRFPEAVIIEAYGLTEVTMGITSNVAHRSGRRKTGSVGIPVFDTEMKIVPLEGTETEPLPAGVKGEICVRGPQIMQGYYKKPEETARVLKDGWLYTGDIGIMDEDGYLSIVDRKKDMLIYKGYNVYPRELEEILYRHPAVAQAAVIGKPDVSVGEIPKAFVVLKNNAKVSELDVMNDVNEQVAPYKKLREVDFVDEIPTSPAGKVLKRVFREQEMKKAQDI